MTIDGVWIGNWIFGHLQQVIIFHFNSIYYTLQLTRARTYSSQSALSNS
jgi:hypothetical protein